MEQAPTASPRVSQRDWRARLALAGAILAVGGVLFLTLWPNAPTPQIADIANIDKLYHAGAWGLLALVTYVPFFRRRALACWLALVAFGVAIELAQHFLPPRSADVWDAVADAIGAGAGCLLIHAWDRRRRRLAR